MGLTVCHFGNSNAGLFDDKTCQQFFVEDWIYLGGDAGLFSPIQS